MAAVVIKDVPPDIVVMGHPARIKYSRTEYDRKKAEWDLHAQTPSKQFHNWSYPLILQIENRT